MVGTLLRLHLKLTARELTASTTRIVVTILVGLYALSMVVLLMAVLVALRDDPAGVRPAITVLGLSALTVNWLSGTLLVTGTGGVLDPGVFALLPVRARALLPGLVLSALVSIGGLMSVALVVGYVIAWSSGLDTLVAAMLGGGLGLALCVVSSRALASGLSAVLQRRRSKDLAVIGTMVVILGGSVALQLLAPRMEFDVKALLVDLTSAARVVGWTPLGWPWAVPADVAVGAWGAAATKLGLSLGTLGLLTWAWERSLVKDLTSPLESTGDAERVAATNRLDRLFPNSPAGAVARRSVRYWRRDPRRLAQAVGLIAVPVVLVIAFTFGDQVGADVSVIVAFLSVFGSMMAASAVAWDLSYDGSALWIQITAGVSGLDDRKGRTWAYLALFGPYHVALTVGLLWYSGRWDLAPGVIGASLCALLAGIGVGNWVGSIWQVAQPPVGKSVFRKGAGGGMESFVGSMLTLILPSILIAPVVVLGVLGSLAGSRPLLGWLALLLGTIVGSGVLIVFTQLGGRYLDDRWPEVLKKITWDRQ